MEVLVSTDKHKVGDECNASVNIWNPLTGTKLLSLKGPPATPHSLTLLRDEGILIGEEGKGKPFLHLWQTGTPLQSSKRIMCPVGQQKLGPVTATPDGAFIAVAITEKINIWQTATGRVVQVLGSGHYREVTVLKFTDDGSLLISCGADGIVSVWSLLQLLSKEESKPLYSWSHHSLPVTGMIVGSGGRKSTLFTCSEDRFLKVYSLLSGSLLLSVAFPTPLRAIAVDGAEQAVYMGSEDGTIYQMNIAAPPRSLEHQITHDGGADAVFKKHQEGITALALSSDGRNLASGDNSGCLLLWDLQSRQAIRTIVSSNQAPISNLAFWLNDPELLKGRVKKPRLWFPEVPKLIEANEGEGELLVHVWNREEQEEEDECGGNEETQDAFAEINELKRKLLVSQGLNGRLKEFCMKNILINGLIGGEQPPAQR